MAKQEKIEFFFPALEEIEQKLDVHAPSIRESKELLNEANYPEDKALRTLAQNLISQRIV